MNQVIEIETPAVLARRAILEQLGSYDIHRDPLLSEIYKKEVVTNFDWMLRGLPTPFFDMCDVVRDRCIELIKHYQRPSARAWGPAKIIVLSS